MIDVEDRSASTCTLDVSQLPPAKLENTLTVAQILLIMRSTSLVESLVVEDSFNGMSSTTQANKFLPTRENETHRAMVVKTKNADYSVAVRFESSGWCPWLKDGQEIASIGLTT